MSLTRILLVQLAANGDCLFVTTIARQIKEVDFPGCHLTWLIGDKYKSVLGNNPCVDEIVEIPIHNTDEMIAQRLIVEQHVQRLKQSASFHHVFITDYVPGNYRNWFGTTRSSLFRSYPYKLRVDPQPQVFLTKEEVSRVSRFCRERRINDECYNILFECSPQSGQSRMTFETARTLSGELVRVHPGVNVILSTAQGFVSDDPRIIDGSTLSWRENAELANHCHLLVGCSSGISWLCTSSWTKPLPFIQVINSNYVGGRFSASMDLDFRYFGIDSSLLIELNNPADELLKEVISAAIGGRFASARRLHAVEDNVAFRSLRFLAEARIGFGNKIWFFCRYAFPHILFQLYRSLKPAGFHPVVWFKNRRP